MTILDGQRPARRRPRPGLGIGRLLAAGAVAAAVLLGALAAGRMASSWWRGEASMRLGPRFAVAALRYDASGALDGALLVEIRTEEAAVDVRIVPPDRTVPVRGERKPLRDVFAVGGPEAAAAALADLIGRPPEAYVAGGPEAFSRFVDALGGIPLPVREDLKYEVDGRSVVVPAGEARYDGDEVEEYLAYPWREPVGAARAVAVGCVRRAGDLAAAGLPTGEIWEALAEGYDGSVPPEVFARAAEVARSVGPTSLSVVREEAR